MNANTQFCSSRVFHRAVCFIMLCVSLRCVFHRAVCFIDHRAVCFIVLCVFIVLIRVVCFIACVFRHAVCFIALCVSSFHSIQRIKESTPRPKNIHMKNHKGCKLCAHRHRPWMCIYVHTYKYVCTCANTVERRQLSIYETHPTICVVYIYIHTSDTYTTTHGSHLYTYIYISICIYKYIYINMHVYLSIEYIYN